MARNDDNNNNGMGQRLGFEEVGKLIGSAVASALSSYEQSEGGSWGSNSNGGNEDGLRRNKDGSIDQRQFNNGQGDNSDANE